MEVQGNSLKNKKRVLILEADKSYFTVHLKPTFAGVPDDGE
jgi:hypothetical protein